MSVRIQPGASAGRFILELRFAPPEDDASLPAVSLSGKDLPASRCGGASGR